MGEEKQQNTTWTGNSAGSGLYVGQGERRPPQQGPRVPPHTHRRRSTAHLMKSFVRTAVVISRAAIDDASPQTDTPSFDYFSQPNLCLLLDKASTRLHSTSWPEMSAIVCLFWLLGHFLQLLNNIFSCVGPWFFHKTFTRKMLVSPQHIAKSALLMVTLAFSTQHA